MRWDRMNYTEFAGHGPALDNGGPSPGKIGLEPPLYYRA
jgi:hypothetical protein